MVRPFAALIESGLHMTPLTCGFVVPDLLLGGCYPRIPPSRSDAFAPVRRSEIASATACVAQTYIHRRDVYILSW